MGRCSPASIPCPIRLQAPGRAALLCQEHTRQPDAAASPHLAHTGEKRQERWASRGSRWAPVSSHMSGDQCFGLCINQKKKTKKKENGKKTPPSVRFLITWSSDAMWKKKFGSSSLFSLSEQERRSLISHIYHSTPHPFGKAAKRGPLP